MYSAGYRETAWLSRHLDVCCELIWTVRPRLTRLGDHVKRLAVVVSIFFTVSLGVAPPSMSAQEAGVSTFAPAKNYKSCKQLNRKFKNGIAMSKYFAKRAVEEGYLRPKVKPRLYWKNDSRLERSGEIGFLCPRTPPPPKINEPSAVANLVVTPGEPTRFGDTPSIDVCFQPPGLGNERKDAVYDLYLDGQLWEEGIPNYLSGEVTPFCDGPVRTKMATIEPLLADTTYTVGVRARNELGVGPLLEASVTTLPQQAFDRYGQTLITYEVTGTAGDYSFTIENSSGGVQQGYTGNGTFYEDWFFDDRFVYMSVQNQTGAGSVTCTIKRNGQVYKQSTSNGAYVIATCSGRS